MEMFCSEVSELIEMISKKYSSVVSDKSVQFWSYKKHGLLSGDYLFLKGL